MTQPASLTLEAGAVTVEYDNQRGREYIIVLPFPHPGEDDGVRFVGTLEELRGMVDTMSSLLDDLEE